MFGINMVRFGSPDLRTSALGVKRVRGIVSPYSRAKQTPKKAPNWQNSKIWPLQNLCLQLKGSDYGLLKKCQNEKMQFFIANRFPYSRGEKHAKKGPERPKFKTLPPIYF